MNNEIQVTDNKTIMDDHNPGEKPLDIEMAFGDPEAFEKAAKNISEHPWCIKYELLCPWHDLCGQGEFLCPIEVDERSRVHEKQAHRHP